ncbi:MAG: SIR2 family protein, partial [Bacteroidales bacterium]
MNNNETNYFNKLEEIKSKLNAEDLSVMVGAGFSKNVNKDFFPSWDELLYDLVLELYQKEIEDTFIASRHLSYNLITKETSEKDTINKILDREGYLEVVSQYIQKKGYREAITAYIESKFPIIINNEEKKYLELGGERKEIKEEDLKLHKMLLDLKWNNIYTTNYDSLIEEAVYQENLEKYNIVSHSSELQNNKSNNIIKLHGSLRKDEDNCFEFDGDIHKRYVIAKEDYETYPKKHEAFTQLMRISLLQESFVLIGFSGNDPNFISWVGWVRDILEKKNGNGDNKGMDSDKVSYKIYLLDLSDKDPLPKDKELFYTNHRICRIPILNEELIAKLKVYDNDEEKKETKYHQALRLIFNYLNPNTGENKFWTKINQYISKSSNLQELYSVDEFNQLIPKINSSSIQKKKILFETIAKLKSTKNDEINYSNQQFICYHALKESFLTIEQLYGKNNQIKKELEILIDNKELKELLEKLSLREKAFTNDSSLEKDITKNPDSFEEILYYAYNLNFKKLKELVDNWDPERYYIINKLGFALLFDTPHNIINLIESQIPKDIITSFTNEEKIYSDFLFSYLKSFNGFDDKYFEHLKKMSLLRKSDLNHFEQNKIFLFEGLKKQEEKKINPYGSNRFIIEYKFSWSNEYTPIQKSLQLLQNIIKVGYPITKNGRSIISSNDWYIIFKNIFETYPYPALFYSLQYLDKDYKFQRRIAQDMIFSETCNLYQGIVGYRKG